MSSQKDRAKERRQKIEQLRSQQQRADRRRNLLIIGSAVVVALAIIASTVLVVLNTQEERAAVEEAAKGPIDGVRKFDDQSRNHVTGTVDYEQTPPVGGDHHPTWTNCGVYDETPDVEKSVHSLEHGAVWITYRPDLDKKQVDALTNLVKNEPFGLLSPFEGLDSPIVASAWGLQLEVDDADDPRLAAFMQKYLQGDQTPEPGAPCSGGSAGM